MRTTITFLDFLKRLGVTPEPAQRVFYAVAADGVQPKDLRGDEREIAREMFGDVDVIPRAARRTVAAIKGAEVGWSFFGGLRLLHRAVTADISDSARGEIRFCLSVGPDIRLGRTPVQYALGAAEAEPAIAKLLSNVTTDGFTVMREGGRKVRVGALPASVGGRATRGKRFLEVLVDESEFFKDESSGQVNDADIYRSVIARCKGTTWIGSTPWIGGLLKTLHDENFAEPRTALAATLPTLVMRTDEQVRAAVRNEFERDPESAGREFGCQFLPRGTQQFFDPLSIRLAIEEMESVA